jgi:DNA-binding transcriptional LysR family regulator
MVDADIACGKLMVLFPDYQSTSPFFEAPAWLLYPSRTCLPQKVRAMIDYLKEQMART